MQLLEVSGAVRPLKWSLGVKGLRIKKIKKWIFELDFMDYCLQEIFSVCRSFTNAVSHAKVTASPFVKLRTLSKSVQKPSAPWSNRPPMVKGKAVPLQAWTGQQGSRKLRLPDFVTTAQDGGKVVSLTQAAFTPRKYSRYSFLLEAESTPGP